MTHRTRAIVCFALSAASAAFIRHGDTAMFYQILFIVVGAYDLLAGETWRAKG